MARYEDTAHTFRGSKTHDFGSLADAAVETTTITVPGAVIGDFVIVSLDKTLGGCHFRQPVINTAGVVSVTLVNNSGGTVDVASGVLSVLVFKR